MKDQVVTEIEIAAPPERVFRALTDPKELSVWWAGEGNAQVTVWQLDLRLGGKWRCEGSDKSCGYWMLEGEVVELDPPRSFAYTWNETLIDKPRGLHQTLVRYELEATATGTRVRVTHSGFFGHQAADEYTQGWPGVLNCLRKHFAAVSA